MSHKLLPSPSALRGLFGLAPSASWPQEGLQRADGSDLDVWCSTREGTVALWVAPGARVHCTCPRCGATVSAWHLERHLRSHS